jgi:NhaP-type Na+/H+ or K+/H+ antiporter
MLGAGLSPAESAARATGLAAPWTIATLVVAASLVVHGLSATPLTRWYDRRGARTPGRAPRPSRGVSVGGRLRA